MILKISIKNGVIKFQIKNKDKKKLELTSLTLVAGGRFELPTFGL